MSEPPTETASASASIRNEGELSSSPPEAILAFCEAERFSGSLRFETPRAKGALPMLAGLPEIPENDRRIARAFEAFLAASEGRYTLHELLPDLEHASRTGDTSFEGTLGQLTLGGLLRYCGEVGLTGQITLSRPERGVLIRYMRGELSSITVNDQSDADLVTLFAWSEGRFAIRARSVFAQTASPEVTAGQLTAIEVALADVLSRTERPPATAPSGASPFRSRFGTLPFGLNAGSNGDPQPEVNPDDERWEPSEATSGRLHKLATMPPPARPEGRVKIYRVDRDPTGAYPAIRLDEDARATTSVPAPPPVEPPASMTLRTANLALQQTRKLLYVLAGGFAFVALLAAYLLGRLSH